MHLRKRFAGLQLVAGFLFFLLFSLSLSLTGNARLWLSHRFPALVEKTKRQHLRNRFFLLVSALSVFVSCILEM